MRRILTRKWLGCWLVATPSARGSERIYVHGWKETQRSIYEFTTYGGTFVRFRHHCIARRSGTYRKALQLLFIATTGARIWVVDTWAWIRYISPLIGKFCLMTLSALARLELGWKFSQLLFVGLYKMGCSAVYFPCKHASERSTQIRWDVGGLENFPKLRFCSTFLYTTLYFFWFPSYIRSFKQRLYIQQERIWKWQQPEVGCRSLKPLRFDQLHHIPGLWSTQLASPHRVQSPLASFASQTEVYGVDWRFPGPRE